MNDFLSCMTFPTETGVIVRYYGTITLPTYKQSFSISCQNSPFCKIFAQPFLKSHLHVFPKHGKLYIDGIFV